MAELTLPLARGAVASLLASSDLERGSAALSAILSVYPRDYRCAVLSGRLALAQGDPAKAFLSFQQAAEADPEDRAAREGMAACGGQEGAVVLGDLPPLGSLGSNGSARPAISAVALGHLYLRSASGGLLTHCTAQLTPLWHSHRQRLDVGAALAEAHWRLREADAAEAVCRDLLEMAPENLKANLILGQQAWAAGQRAVAEPYLARAQAVDPENAMAERLYEWLRARDEGLAPLRYTPVRVAVPDGVPVGPNAPAEADEPVRFWSPPVGVPVAGRLGVLRRAGPAPARPSEPPTETPAGPEPAVPNEAVAARSLAPPQPDSEPVPPPAGAPTEAPQIEPLPPAAELGAHERDEPALAAELPPVPVAASAPEASSSLSESPLDEAPPQDQPQQLETEAVL
ncbi:MAG TPA: tetratricopeptide repeat protein, partial [Chloroflexota bacterium]|nr:tetratricopeptide repeat protein [Chloroflexota bacterium]